MKLRTSKYHDVKIGDRVICIVRPEKFSLIKSDKELNAIECEVTNVIFLGKSNRVYGKIDNMTIIAEIPTDVSVNSGDRVILYTSVDETTFITITQ